jgi:hypothetical protein
VYSVSFICIVTCAVLFECDVCYLCVVSYCSGTRGSLVRSSTMLQAGRSRVRVPMRWIFQLT